MDGNVTITVDPDDPYIVYVAGLIELDGLPEDKGPLKMVVNPLNFEVTAVKTVLATNFFLAMIMLPMLDLVNLIHVMEHIQ